MPSWEPSHVVPSGRDLRDALRDHDDDDRTGRVFAVARDMHDIDS